MRRTHLPSLKSIVRTMQSVVLTRWSCPALAPTPGEPLLSSVLRRTGKQTACSIRFCSSSTRFPRFLGASLLRYEERISRVEKRIATRMRDQLGAAKTADDMFRVLSRFSVLFSRPRSAKIHFLRLCWYFHLFFTF